MININASVIGHSLILNNLSHNSLATGSVSVDQIALTFSGSEWTSASAKYAVFWQQPEAVYKVTVTNNNAVIPAEVLTKRGIVHVAIYGDLTGGARISTNEVTFEAEQGALTEETAPAPTASMFEQAVDAAVQEVIDGGIIDSTLSMSLKAADAKVTGDRLLDATKRYFAIDRFPDSQMVSSWSYGAISSTDGTNSGTSTNYVRSGTFHPTLRFHISLAGDYDIRVFRYTASGSGYVGCTAWTDGAVGLDVDPATDVGTYYRYNVAKRPRTAISSADIEYIKANFKSFRATDDTLELSGYPADALAVGREFAHFDTLEEGIASSALWEGSIRKGYTIINGDGSQTNNKRARTSFVPGNKVCIELTGGYECFVAGYGEGPELTVDNFIGTLVPSWASGFFAVPRTAPKISVVFRRTADDRALTDDDIADIRANFKLYSIVDGTLTQRGVPADAYAVGKTIEDVKATSGITTKRNNPFYVAQIKALAESYLNQGFVYGQDTLLDWDSYVSKTIDCSTYVGLLLRGRGFADTRYGNSSITTATSKTANSEYGWSINPYDFLLQKYTTDDTLYPVRMAAQLAQWMVENGQRVPLDSCLSNVLPGDIVFYARKNQSTGEWQCPDRYKHISHVGIITERVPADSSVPWDTTKLPWIHTVMDSTTREGSIGTRILESGAESDPDPYVNNYHTIVMICRPDLGTI